MGIFDLFKPTASGGTLEDIRRENQEADPSRVLYQTGMGGLEQLQREQSQRFQAARTPQTQAVDVLGERAATLEGGQAMLQTQAAREQAQASAMAAGRTMYGNREAGPEAAILGGQIGAAAAPSMAGLQEEAAARQAAYVRGVGALGAATTQEAEERRRVEQVMLQDLQARYAAAMQQAQYERQREAEERARLQGAFMQAIPAGLSFLGKGQK
jgi:hypothetical protein